jgi:phosphohistidine phosphatase
VKRLIFLRHAKAAGAAPNLDDRDRLLAPRGRADAIRMGQFLREEDCVPGHVLCSPAARTRQTLELVVPQLGSTPVVQMQEELYLARWMSIINHVRQVKSPAAALMVVGHNPGLEDCAKKLARPPGDSQARKLHEALQAQYPTGAVAVFDFETAAWSGIERGEGELVRFVCPKDLRGPE